MGTEAVIGKVSMGTTPEPDWDEPRFQRWLVATARANGWRVRIMDQRGRPGWRGQAADKGLPDLLMAKDRVVWMELKAKGGKLRPDQVEWIAALREAKAEVHVVDPTDWEFIMSAIL